jgi:uncharacterized protein DUF6265
MSRFSKTAPLPIVYASRMKKTLALLAMSVTTQGADLPALTWMSGCWSMTAGQMTIDEQWSKPAGGTMLGVGRTLKQDRLVFHEFMRIEQQGAEVTYTPRIGTGAKPVSFKLVKQTAEEVVFENPTHDFPQRIIYRKVAGGLHARIEGVDKGKPRSEDFPYKRVSCE